MYYYLTTGHTVGFKVNLLNCFKNVKEKRCPVMVYDFLGCKTDIGRIRNCC